MTNTQYYNLTKAEGSDTVNLLTQNYPNFDIIDNAMHANAVATVSTAVETKVGTTHQIVRTNSECAMFRFVATSNWTAGDSFTVDGVAVTAVAVDGQALQTGAFIINANVLCCVVGGLMTVYVGGGSAIAEDSNKLGGQLPAYYAKQSEVTTLNSNLTDLETLDFSNTNIEPTTSFNGVVQMLMNKLFPKRYYLVENGVLRNGHTTSLNGSNTGTVSYKAGYIEVTLTNSGLLFSPIARGQYKTLHIVAKKVTSGATALLSGTGYNTNPKVEMPSSVGTEYVLNIETLTIINACVTVYNVTNAIVDIYDLWLE